VPFVCANDCKSYLFRILIFGVQLFAHTNNCKSLFKNPKQFWCACGLKELMQMGWPGWPSRTLIASVRIRYGDLGSLRYWQRVYFFVLPGLSTGPEAWPWGLGMYQCECLYSILQYIGTDMPSDIFWCQAVFIVFSLWPHVLAVHCLHIVFNQMPAKWNVIVILRQEKTDSMNALGYSILQVRTLCF